MNDDEKMAGFLKELESFDEIIAVSPNTVREMQTRIAELEQQNARLRERWEKLKGLVSLEQSPDAPFTVTVIELMKDLETL